MPGAYTRALTNMTVVLKGNIIIETPVENKNDRQDGGERNE